MTYSPRKIRNNLEIFGDTLTLDSDNTGPGQPVHILANQGSSGTPAEIKFNSSIAKWQFSNDGLAFSDFGSGTGGSGVLSSADNLIPAIDDGYKIGSSSFRWSDGYFGPHGIHLLATLSQGGPRHWRTSLSSDGYYNISEGASRYLTIGDGYVGIGTTLPRQKLEVSGQIHSNLGGFRFPDNTVQITAATNAGTPGGLSGEYQINNSGSLAGASLKELNPGIIQLVGPAGNDPIFYIKETDASTDSKNWYFTAQGDAFYWGLNNDALNSGANYAKITRSTNRVSSIDFQTGASPTSRLFMDNQGYVGLGTTSPAGILHVKTPAGTDTGQPRFLSEGGLSSFNELILGSQFSNYSSSIWRYTNGAGTASSAIIKLFHAGDGDTEGLNITGGGGRVGIGTLNNTTEPLVVKNAWSIGGGVKIMSSDNFPSRFGIINSGSQTASYMELGLALGTNDFVSGASSGDIVLRQGGAARKLFLATNDIVRLTVDGTGSVGIGTISPDSAALLHVRGTGSSTANWKGRIIAGGDNVAFLMGEYNSQAWLGAHNAALTAWSDFYINPDGGAKVFIGDADNTNSAILSPILTVDNTSGNVGVNTSGPTQKLHVAGQIYSSTGGFRFPDNTVQTTASVSTSPGGSNTSVQFNSSGSFAGTNRLVYTDDTVEPVLYVTNAQQPYIVSVATVTDGTGAVAAAAPNVNSYLRAFGSTLGPSFYSGSVNAGSVTWEGIGSGLTSMVIATAANIPLKFVLNDSEKMRLTAAGNLGIGTNTPSQKLEVAGTIYSNTGGFRFPDNTVQTTAAAGANSVGGTGAVQFANGTGFNGDSNFFWDNTNKSLGIGTTNPVANLHVASSSISDFILETANDSPSFPARATYKRTRGSLSAPTANQADDVIGQINFQGYTDLTRNAARIAVECDTGWGASGADSPGRIILSTTPDGSSSPLERLRITSAGLVGINNASPTSKLHIDGSFALAIINKSADYTATGNDYTILVTASTVNIIITLPTAIGIAGRIYKIKRMDNTEFTTTIATTSSQTIDGVTTSVLGAQYQVLTVQSDGSNWVEI